MALYIVFVIVSFLASVLGSVCGIGGGVLIKPVLDAFGILDVAAISFLSGCTVLSMSCYSVVKARMSGSSLVDRKTGVPLAVGAVLGGVIGKTIFQYILGTVTDKEQVGAVQAACLLAITFLTFLYTLNKDKIKGYRISNIPACVVIGIILGIFSSFLGIGGGPINLMVLFFFFSMDTKTAAQNSLYIILFSQAASLVNTLGAHAVPVFDMRLLIFMVFSGILGGAVGRNVNKYLDDDTVSRLFMGLMLIIMLLCVYNMIRFI